ncbi:MAG: hypothetical protein PVG87_20210, partial [Desulfobacteraceae bacterium]
TDGSDFIVDVSDRKYLKSCIRRLQLWYFVKTGIKIFDRMIVIAGSGLYPACRFPGTCLTGINIQ